VQNFLQTVGKAIDWLVLRLIMLLVVGLVAFAVLQPLIWSEILHKKPPANSTDLSSLMTIVVTIIGLALAGFGVVVYQLAERKNEARLEKLGNDLQKTLQSKADKFRADAEQFQADAIQFRADASDLRVDIAISSSKNLINLSVQSFLSYEDLWGKAQPPYALDFLNDDRLKKSLKDAIRNSKLALTQLESLPPPLRLREEVARGILASKGNYVYFLATRADPGDKKSVIEMATELDGQRINTHKLETVAWAYLRYSTPAEPLWEVGLSRLATLMTRSDLSPEDAKTLRERYKGTFFRDGAFPPGLGHALGLVSDTP
jgi:hypothetical protein